MALTHLLYSPAEVARDVGKNARKLRLAKNLSRRSLAEQSGVSASTIKRFELTGSITLEAMILLATPLDQRTAIAKIFNPDQPGSLEELKNSRRQRGVR